MPLHTSIVERGVVGQAYTKTEVDTLLAAKLNITSLVFPFYVAAGTLDSIALTADQKLPFFDSTATAKNIALTT
jgi:hypothetical protein